MSWYNPNGVQPGAGWGGNFAAGQYPQGIANATPQQIGQYSAQMNPGLSPAGAGAQANPGLMQRLMAALGNPSQQNLMNASNQMFQAAAPRQLPSGATALGGGGGQMPPPSIMQAMQTLRGGSGLPGVGGAGTVPGAGAGGAGGQMSPMQLQQLMQALQQFRQGQ